jgi:hypothetical protein
MVPVRDEGARASGIATSAASNLVFAEWVAGMHWVCTSSWRVSATIVNHRCYPYRPQWGLICAYCFVPTPVRTLTSIERKLDYERVTGFEPV